MTVSNGEIFISEFTGTAMLLLLGCGVVATAILKGSKGEGGGWLLINFGWGLAVFAGVYVAFRSGAHLNPAVSFAFALRGDFPWRRVPGYIVVQLIGASLAALFLHAVIGVSASNGSNYPATGYSNLTAFVMEAVLTFGLVSVILGTASGAQNIGVIGALGVGGYIALAGLWGSPISGASMNPARTFGPDLVSLTFDGYWVYVTGPLLGAVVAVGCAFVLRGPGGGRSGSEAAQGTLFTEVNRT